MCAISAMDNGKCSPGYSVTVCVVQRFSIPDLADGIMAEYPVMSTSQGTCVRIEQTSEAIRVTYEICRAGGARGLV